MYAGAMNNTETLVHTTLANGGSTFAADGSLVTSGFSVAGIAPAVRIPVAAFTAEALAATIALFAGSATFGTWIEDGEVWIEPTNVLTDAAEADALARERDEIAYFDLDSMTEIRLR